MSVAAPSLSLFSLSLPFGEYSLCIRMRPLPAIKSSEDCSDDRPWLPKSMLSLCLSVSLTPPL